VSTKHILVVDDDNNLRMILRESLETCGYEVIDAPNGEMALEILKNNKFDLMITDLMMPGIKGIELIEKARERQDNLGCLVITAYGTVEKAVEAMQKGAFDFITKPFSISHLESRIERFFEYESLQRENRNLKRQLSIHKRQKKLIGNSKPMEEILQNIDVVAGSDATVFIRGASGTGKELIAQAIHDCSDREDNPFLKINCAAVPETLFESTLFGHEKGSFSGAYKTKKGIFEECDGGTLLLDEISEIPYAMQAKLLRVLQEMKVTKVGSTTESSIDVRIIATSNRNINEMINKGSFREDLFFRLNVFPIEVLPLKDRKEDIPVLLEYFFGNYKKKYHFENKTLSENALEKLINYSWPGNVRQLEHMLERAILLSGKNDIISEKNFDFETERDEQTLINSDQIETLAEMEKKLIFAALKNTNNHRAKAAELLGISARTLRNKLNLYDSGKFDGQFLDQE